VFTLASVIPNRLAISFVERPPATARRTSRWRLVSAATERGRRARTLRETTYPASSPRRTEAARCTEKVSGAALRAASSAGAPQRAALVGADHLVLETLEEELPAATGAERLIAVVPDGRLLTADVLVRGAKLGNGRPAPARGYEHLAQAVTAEIAIELGSKGHLARNLHPDNG
jgi:hypothetical protein